ncbi:hypothetical protein CLOM_g1478 [Closterium sp. NIES-68]|nr:hypothetical protein CLOM_g1478 [Closterium sp. NIES-68]
MAHLAQGAAHVASAVLRRVLQAKEEESKLKNSIDYYMVYSPSYLIAAVAAVLVIVSLIFEKIIHVIHHRFSHKRNKALVNVVDRIKDELMIAGFLSIILALLYPVLSAWCVNISRDTILIPCKPPEDYKNSSYNPDYNSGYNSGYNSTSNYDDQHDLGGSPVRVDLPENGPGAAPDSSGGSGTDGGSGGIEGEGGAESGGQGDGGEAISQVPAVTWSKKLWESNPDGSFITLREKTETFANGTTAVTREFTTVFANKTESVKVEKEIRFHNGSIFSSSSDSPPSTDSNIVGNNDDSTDTTTSEHSSHKQSRLLRESDYKQQDEEPRAFAMEYSTRMANRRRSAQRLLQLDDEEEDTNGGQGFWSRRLIYESGWRRRRLAKSNATKDDGTCAAQGKEPFMSPYAIHQLHLLIFFILFGHIIYTCVTIIISRARVSMWHKWEVKCQESVKKCKQSIPGQLREALNQKSFVERHTGKVTAAELAHARADATGALAAVYSGVGNRGGGGGGGGRGGRRGGGGGGGGGGEEGEEQEEWQEQGNSSCTRSCRARGSGSWVGMGRGCLETPPRDNSRRRSSSWGGAAGGEAGEAAGAAAAGVGQAAFVLGAGFRLDPAAFEITEEQEDYTWTDDEEEGDLLSQIGESVGERGGGGGGGGGGGSEEVGWTETDESTRTLRIAWREVGKSLTVWRTFVLTLRCFWQQLFDPVTRSDYSTLRLAFVHNQALPRDFDFLSYVIGSLEKDYVHIVGVNWFLWVLLVIIICISSYKWDISFILAIVGFLVALAVGTKLEYIVSVLALESAHVKGDCEGDHLKPHGSLFWFKRPSFMLHLLHFALFVSSYMVGNVFTYFYLAINLKECKSYSSWVPWLKFVIGLLTLLLVSLSTLPLYALVTHMGTKARSTAFHGKVLDRLKSHKARSHRHAEGKH